MSAITVATQVSPEDRVVRCTNGKKVGVDFLVNNDTAIQVRMALISLYDDKALDELSEQPKKRKGAEQTLDRWFGTTPPAKMAKPTPEEPTVTAKLSTIECTRVVILLCFLYDAPLLDPSAERFPREVVANATSNNDVRVTHTSHTHRL